MTKRVMVGTQVQSMFDWYRVLDVYSTMALWWENQLRLRAGTPRLYLTMLERRNWYIDKMGTGL